MIRISGGRFARATRGGTKRVRVQVLQDNAGTLVPVAGATVTFQPVDADAFSFHDGAGSDEVLTDAAGFSESNVTCARRGTCRLAVTCPGHPDEHLDVEVDIVRSASPATGDGQQQIQVVRAGGRQAAPPQPPVVIIIDD